MGEAPCYIGLHFVVLVHVAIRMPICLAAMSSVVGVRF